jgi:glycosyltransferase involved in cell wall biosynthesis
MLRVLLHAMGCRLFSAFWTTGSRGFEYLSSIGVPPERIARGLYPVDTDWWQQRVQALRDSSRRLRERLTKSPGAFIILAVSKLSGRENPFLILSAFTHLSAKLADAQLVLVGDGPLRGSLEERVRELGIARAVHLPGYVAYERLAEYYGAADVFVHLPERGPWELSVAEAMACGLPVISHKEVGAAVDLVVESKTGFLAERGDPEDTARCLHCVAQWRDKDSVARTVLERVRTVTDIRVACQEFEQLVRRLPEAPPFEPMWRSIAQPWTWRRSRGRG